ncbi:ABC transporter substrate-binding protein [Gallaecimonas sp. GXIMD4217]|uniref:ABC transporter substrate-binding protein n=1 Tax=Gallaecimonas sp. GXIMD4217 TaxID=3131927 RepID=UPI00311ABF4C
MLKRTLIALLALVTVVLPAQADSKIDRSNPYTMVEEAAQIAFARLKASRNDIRANPNLLKLVVEEELLPYVDYKYAAYKVMGKNYRNISKEDRDRFVVAFRGYLVTTYAQAFTLYDEQEVKFANRGQNGDSNIAVIKALILDPKAPEVEIAFKARRNSKTGQWGVYDMVAEGISLLSSKRAELEGLIRQKGVETVITMLNEKAASDIVFKKEAKAGGEQSS